MLAHCSTPFSIGSFKSQVCESSGYSIAPLSSRLIHGSQTPRPATLRRASLRKNITAAASPTPPPKKKVDDVASAAEAATRKFGLEAGLWKVFTTRDDSGRTKGDQAKELLKRYGSAYLLTSISFAIVSFAACYALVNAGVDVRSLLAKIGLQVTDTSERVGTFAVAYAAHKALSPVRFPPTVALTPVVAKWLGKEVDNNEPGEGSDDAQSS